jgi:hypothetical protein
LRPAGEPERMAGMRIWLLLVALWCWGIALSTLVGPMLRVIFGVVGIAAFIWFKRTKPKTPATSGEVPPNPVG